MNGNYETKHLLVIIYDTYERAISVTSRAGLGRSEKSLHIALPANIAAAAMPCTEC